MPTALQDGIDLASTQVVDVRASITMHDSSHVVMFGMVEPAFLQDVPVRTGPATIAPPAGWGRRARLIPGFSTWDLPRPGSNLQLNELVSNDRNTVAAPVKTQWFDVAQAVPIDFSVRRDPGSPILNFFGRGPSIQIEIETRTTPGSAVRLDAVQDGLLLRAVGPSLRDASRTASYTVALDVSPRPTNLPE